jgi:hypothetical protein
MVTIVVVVVLGTACRKELREARYPSGGMKSSGHVTVDKSGLPRGVVFEW